MIRTVFVSTEPIAYSEGLDECGSEVFSFHPDGFWKLTGPGIYIAMKGSTEQGDFEVLYVGSAKNILARIAEDTHESLREALRQKGCRLMIISCKSEKHAREEESRCIFECQPTLNIRGKSNGEIARAIQEESEHA
jgi:excinuclease UvrABC nuclease subunit